MLSITLSISYFYLLAIIYKLVIICKGYYVTVTAPANKDPQLPLHTISIRFPHTLSTHIHTLYVIEHTHLFTNSYILSYSLTHTYLSVEVIYFIGPPLCRPNKCYSSVDVWSPWAYLNRIHPDVCQHWILVALDFGKYSLITFFSSNLLFRFNLILLLFKCSITSIIFKNNPIKFFTFKRFN